nr:PepSY domain-containing protein [Methanothermus fervidus]
MNSKKSIALAILVIGMIGVVIAGYNILHHVFQGVGNPTKNFGENINKPKNINEGSKNKNVMSTEEGNNPKKGDKESTEIGHENAKNIASKYIEEPGASPGSPKIVYIDGKPVYVVPVIKNGKQVGEIYIDVKTGKNLGGAGGAPGG